MVGVAYMKGKIVPRVSDALVSSLDFLPTFAALAKITLPSDRTFDGIDISDVIFGGDDSKGHHTLFHPNALLTTGSEQEGSWYARARSVPAMRLGQYKAFFFTHGSSKGGCLLANGTHRSPPGKSIEHFPTGGGVPLIFGAHSNPLNFLSTIILRAWNPNIQTRSQCRPIGIAATYQRATSVAGLKV